MLTNRQKQVSTGTRAASAAMWSCAEVVRRGVVASAGLCQSSSPAYLHGVELGCMGAKAIGNPRFADQLNQI